MLHVGSGRAALATNGETAGWSRSTRSVRFLRQGIVWQASPAKPPSTRTRTPLMMTRELNRRHVLKLGAAASLAPGLPLHGGQDDHIRPMGVALLGLGNYSEKQLAPALQRTRYAKLRGIITGSPEKIGPWREKYGIPEANAYTYGTMDQIADNDEIDIIYVVTPTGVHPEYSIRASQAGKHVICEKPMAPTVEDCTRMIEAAKEAGRTLQIGYRLHWEPYHLRLMEAVREKQFGDWRSIEAVDASRMTNFDLPRHQWRISRDLGIAGALYDLGVYAVQAQLYSAQALPVRVTATKSTEREEHFDEVPETYEWTLEFEDGREATGMSSYGKSGNLARVEVDEGVIELEPAYGYSGQEGSTPGGAMDYPQVNQQALQMDGQVLAIRRGEDSRVPGEMGRRDIRVIRGIMEAAETGQPFEFGDFGYPAGTTKVAPDSVL